MKASQPLPHGPLEQLAHNLWRVKAPVPGMSLERVMVVVRRKDGLVIHNAIALNETSRAELERLGSPRYLLVPSALHRMDCAAYKAMYREMLVYAPLGARKKVEEKVPVDGGSFDDFPHDETIRLETLPGVASQEGVVHVSSEDGHTLVFNDLIMNMAPRKDVLGYLITTALGSAPGPRISRLSRLMLVKDKAILRERLQQLAETKQLVRLIVGHDEVAHGPDAKAALQTALRYLD